MLLNKFVKPFDLPCFQRVWSGSEGMGIPSLCDFLTVSFVVEDKNDIFKMALGGSKVRLVLFIQLSYDNEISFTSE